MILRAALADAAAEYRVAPLARADLEDAARSGFDGLCAARWVLARGNPWLRRVADFYGVPWHTLVQRGFGAYAQRYATPQSSSSSSS